MTETLKTWMPLIAVALFALLFAAERLRPLRQTTRSARGRLVTNGVVVALALGVGAVTVAPTTMALLAWTRSAELGLLHVLALPAPLSVAAGILLLDLSFYWWHRLNHVWPLLWRFHNVHHIDPDLDSTTAFRFHPGEIAYSAAFRAAQIALIGPNVSTLILYEALFLSATLFHHSNIRLPLGLERMLNRVLVTPRMHGVHHSTIRDETNANYSVVFRWWDQLHGTLRLNVPQDDIRVGVAAYDQRDDNAPLSALTLPFKQQRDYWRTTHGTDSRVRTGWHPDACARMAG
ncbi:MAG: sterol desaturase family protein [Lentisphaeria bacterium]|nr:sterol desaturase family protein [Lentisphaeria bacterium]